MQRAISPSKKDRRRLVEMPDPTVAVEGVSFAEAGREGVRVAEAGKGGMSFADAGVNVADAGRGAVVAVDILYQRQGYMPS